MRFPHFAVAIGVCGLTCLPGVLADEPNPFGFPKEDARGGVGTYRIWYDGGAWHLRTSTENSSGKKEQLMVFTGSVRCDGKLTAEAKLLEKSGRTGDSIKPTADGKGFDFEFKTYGATDEAVFKVAASAKTLAFKLKIDGVKAAPFRIVIGATSVHPDKSEFKLSAHPKK
jgi:hypothetical protein